MTRKELEKKPSLMAEDIDYNQRAFDLMMEIEGFKRVIDAYTTNKIIEELESVFSDIDGELWYAHPRMAKGNVANEITLVSRLAELRKTL